MNIINNIDLFYIIIKMNINNNIELFHIIIKWLLIIILNYFI